MTPPRWSASAALLLSFVTVCTDAAADDRYADVIRQHEPVAWWRFSEIVDNVVPSAVANGPSARIVGTLSSATAGPRPSEYPDFADDNVAAALPGGRNYLVVEDPGEESLLDFGNTDGLTLEAWVRWEEPLPGRYPYIIGKGRTHRPGMGIRNQNYSLRLDNSSNGVALSFFFCDAETETTGKGGIGEEGHRWTSTARIPEDGAWHHVVLTYVFGEPESIRGYIDGAATDGTWDMGGPTTRKPVVDDDQLWIGSSMWGNNSFAGELDEVAVYRHALTAEQVRQHATINPSAAPFVVGRVPSDAPADHVRVEIVEGLPASRTWEMRLREPEPLFSTDYFAMKNLPHRYDQAGFVDDRPPTSLLHLTSRVELPAGEYEFALRSIDGAQLYVDGKKVLQTPFMNLRSDAHQAYYAGLDRGPDLLSLAEGHSEVSGTVSLEGSTHVVSLYRQFGNKGRGHYLGELIVAVRPVGGDFRILSPTKALPFTDAGWLDFLNWERDHLTEVNRRRRQQRSASRDAYWRRRHEYAREHAAPEIEPPDVAADHPIDCFLLVGMHAAGFEPEPLIDDLDFLRRVSLDTVGTIPDETLIEQYLAFPEDSRRREILEVLLNHAGWADHWVGYWQDVLAENPGLTKPELNNSGPFRWFLHEAFLDNKPFDRFVSELVMMEGSRFTGGPAGFAIASQNDVPMAAKAHILGTAFLGIEMKCARCHDAPYHDVDQAQLFALAGMLKRGAETVPGTSSILVDEEHLSQMAVQVSLKPGAAVAPEWPFAELTSAAPQHGLPDELLQDPKDPREQVAAMLTSPHNNRFAEVIVNRLWKRYVGRGIVEPVDDWEHADIRHPELLDWLARELVISGYDLKHMARLILTSEVYQRAVATDHEAAELFTGPTRRRLTGEQIVDSLLVACGKNLGCEELTMDRDARHSDSTFGHFGIPRRAWEMVSVSNERDRPSLNLPAAQSVIDLLSAYGWRQQRQEPLTDRDSALTPLQPMVLANGTLPNRIVDVSDRCGTLSLCLEQQPVEALVRRLFQRVLTRYPTADEQAVLVELLRDGYEERIVAGPDSVLPRRIYRSGITWSNHFDPKSDEEAIRRQRELLEGDPPTQRLDVDWRQRVEDALWALLNTPEFVFVP